MKKVETLKPFTRFLMTIGEIPSSYLVSMTYEEQLLWFCNYLEKTVIPTIDNNAEAVIELQNYVKNYFDNLDVQEEIDNKLDEMAEDGTLQEIITQYLQINGVLGFNTVSDLVSATNIINGSICKTLGLNSYNDGKGAFYKIRTITSSDTVDGVNIIALNISNTLIAEKIIKNYKTNYKIIGIGDSYGIQQFEDNPITKYYWQFLTDALNLTENKDFFKAYSSGASFANGNFLQAIINLENTIKNKNEITDILITGGWNDTYQNITQEMIIQGMKNLNNYIKTNYPNASIKLGFIGHSNPYITNATANVTLIPKTLEAYKKGADILGWQFLTGCENILHYYDTRYWQEDGVHPSQLGQNELGYYIVQAFLNGNISIFRKSEDTGITMTATGIVSQVPSGRDKFLYTQNNEITKITTIQLNGQYFTLDNTTSLTLNGATSYDLANMTNNVWYGWNNRNSSVQPIEIQVTQNGALKTYHGLANFYITQGKLRFTPLCFDTSTNQAVSGVTGRFLYVSSLSFISDTKMC